MNGVLCVIDFIWLLSIGGIWTTEVAGDEAWNREESLRTFAIVMSGLNMVVKIIICGLVYWYKKIQSNEFFRFLMKKISCFLSLFFS